MFFVSLFCALFFATGAPAQKQCENWQLDFDAQLPILEQRNLILVVDKAFPSMNSAGITINYTNEDLLFE
jgi:hypothetical protein